jgi:prevent-host-death family protein
MTSPYDVTARDFQREPGRWQDEAMRHPVRITRHGRARLVLLAVEEYDRLAKQDRRAFRPENLSESDLHLIAAATPSEESRQFDDEFPAETAPTR